ncbi:pantoate--beta-alanine ligase [Litoreibacter roseus]|uniref:Pantothenate synthetase n=1 Tax=Litoreibacter roseus TaxID=2601869 RepID=A0A6N6JAX4_9RHOB|nr:pantoate--beta-alanine ligase [Litoreibacter roseus]GFE63393.1 pantothenate synthetase [Litoreibacter roseus]
MSAVVRDVKDLRQHIVPWQRKGQIVGLVPTMGALHAGHMALVQAAKGKCDRVVTTIFVNPTQFGAGEDLDSYPDTFQDDLALLSEAAVDLVFAPTRQIVYPEGFATRVEVDGLTDMLCGATRPGHFDGVTQVVAKLLNMAGTDHAFFGEKDWQQLAVIRRMAADLNFSTEIQGVGIVRAEDGLALSSRNAYLTSAERAVAPALNAALMEAAHDIRSGMSAAGACAKASEAVLSAGFERVDYLECRDAVRLTLADHPDAPARVFGAAFLGRARLIDNVSIF